MLCSVNGQFSLTCKSYANFCSMKLTDQYKKPLATATTSYSSSDNKDLSHTTNAAVSPQKEEVERNKNRSGQDDNLVFPHNDNDNAVVIDTGMNNSSTIVNTDNSVGKGDRDFPTKVAATEDVTPLQKPDESIAQKPKFDCRLIPIMDDHNAIRYSDAVYPWHVRMLTALGVKPSCCDAFRLGIDDRKSLCNIALEYLLEQTEDCQNKYALKFEEFLVEKIDIKFTTMRSLLDNELQETIAGCTMHKNDISTSDLQSMSSLTCEESIYSK